MQTANSVLINQAKESLRGKWGLAIGGYLLYYFISTALTLNQKVGFLPVLIIGGLFLFGIQTFFLAIARNQEAKIEQIFAGTQHFGKALGTYLLMLVYILLWMLLLIVPGIIAAFSYSMTFYILVDEPTIGITEALKKSKLLMQGNKWKYFGLILPFMAIPLLFLIAFLIVIIVAAIHQDMETVTYYSNITSTTKGKLIIASISALISWLFVWLYVASAKFYDDIKPKEVVEEIEG